MSSPASIQRTTPRRRLPSVQNTMPTIPRIRMSTSSTILLYHWSKTKTRAVWFSLWNHSRPEVKQRKNTGSRSLISTRWALPSSCSALHQKRSLLLRKNLGFKSRYLILTFKTNFNLETSNINFLEFLTPLDRYWRKIFELYNKFWKIMSPKIFQMSQKMFLVL